MNKIKKFGAVLAVTALAATSTFADQRPRNGSDDWRGGRADGRYERNERRGDRGARNLSAQGRISNLYRDRGGYRVQLDRSSQWYYVPSSAWRSSRDFDLRVGVAVRLGGGYYHDRGYIYVNEADYYGDYGSVSGTVLRVDRRRDVIQLRESRTGRHVTVDARRADRRNRRGIDVADLRRGDYVELEGEWVRGNVFQARRIDSVDSRRR